MKKEITAQSMNANKKNWIVHAFIWGCFIFAVSLIIASLTFFVMNLLRIENACTTVIVAIIQGTVGAITGGFIIPQLKGSREVEIKENEIHIVEFYHSFITYWLETDKMFIEHPECRKYFYSNITVDDLEKGSDQFQLLMAFAEYFDDLFRYSPAELKKQLQNFSVVPNKQIKSYIDYMETMINRPVFQYYTINYRDSVNSNYNFEEIAELKRLIQYEGKEHVEN